MPSLKPLLLATAIALPATPVLACPEDGGDHRYFAFAGQFQDWQRGSQSAPAQDQQGQPSSRSDSGSTSSSGSQDSGSSAPSSSEPAPDGPAAGDAATFR